MPPWHLILDWKIRGTHLFTEDCRWGRNPLQAFPSDVSPRQVAGERNPQRQVAEESPKLSLGKALNVVVRELRMADMTTFSSHIQGNHDVPREIHGIKFPLAEEVPTASEEGCHCQKKREATVRKIALLSKSRRNCQSKSNDSFTKIVPHVTTSSTTTKDTTSGETGKKFGRTVTLTAEDMQKKKNDVKARTILLLSLPDEHQLGNEDGNTACIPTASTNVPTASASVATISQDTACTYIASQSSGSQIKFEDINQIDEDDMEEMDIKWNMALLSKRADKAPRSQDRGRRDNYKQGSKAEEQAPKALMAIDGVGWDWSYMANDGEDYALVADEVAPTEFALMANISAESKKLETLKQEKEGVDGKLAGLLTASKDLDNLIESQRADKNKEGLGYSVLPPPPAQIYSSPNKDLS
nr:hypothetical protein [Tanacetum cinerariifolium]